MKSGTKNSYKILSQKTDQNGEARISQEGIVGQFEDHWEMGLMDYNGSIEEADPIISVSLYSPENAINNKEACLAWPLLKNELPCWESRDERYNYLVSCSNLKYKARTEKLNTNTSSHVVITVCKP